MKKLLSICLVVSAFAVKAQTWNTEEQYIQRFAPYAVEEMELYKSACKYYSCSGAY